MSDDERRRFEEWAFTFWPYPVEWRDSQPFACPVGGTAFNIEYAWQAWKGHLAEEHEEKPR